MSLAIPDDLDTEILSLPGMLTDSASCGSWPSHCPHPSGGAAGIPPGASNGRRAEGSTGKAVSTVSHDPGSSNLAEVALALDHSVGRSLELVAATCYAPSAGRLRSGHDAKPTVAIAVSDSTRPVPNDAILRPVIARLVACGFEQSHVKVIVACGRHRLPREDEARLLANPASIGSAQFLVHNTDEGETVFLGVTSRGTPVNINKDFALADLRIVTGMIEPHQFAGFSGGAKAAVIGLGNEATIGHNHSLLLQEGARAGIFAGNPVRDDIEEAARLVGVHFVVNVVMGPGRRILRAFAGAYPEAYMEGVEFARRLFSVPFRSSCDIVVASCGGYPKDINLYQAQKALAHIEPLVKPGGVIVLLAECPEGIGDEKFQWWIRESAARECSTTEKASTTAGSAMTPESILDRFREDGFQLGVHKAFLLARTMAKAKVFLVSSLPESLAKGLGFEPFSHANRALHAALARLGRAVKVAVVPQGTGMILAGAE